ncbi:glycosyltransferase family 2 protein [Flavobacterium sp.]|uniref:glycosyltransferase family 2 protein n=1 Tax=Flavobacterium sp. TaxID=239 RepID=UPI001B3E9BD8|nr:glycosyltransferase family 2 protein [Flavobacterium sp.]MBP6128159.1 glycosyltransferase family 2 protein [Flavobacterium sp.]
MSNNILISVLIPTYNVEKYIYDAIESVILQSHTNIEIIVVDDCSTDNTYSILQNISLIEPRLKLFRNDQNSGIVKTLNFALSIASGEYIVRMDGDDLSENLKFEKQIDFLLENPDVSLVGCNVFSIDENGKVLNKVRLANNVYCTKKLLNYVSPVLHIWMCKKEIYNILEGYRELGGSEDYDFLLRLNAKGYKFCNIPYYGYSVRIREGNTQTTKGLYQRKIVFYLKELYQERLIKGFDSFDLKTRDIKTKSSFIIEKIHQFSVKNTYKFMKNRSEKRYFIAILYLLSTFISPYQILFFKDILISKFILKKYN